VIRREAVPAWIEKVARVGYATKGAVYLLIGTLAGAAAVKAGGEATDQQGALETLVRQPFGILLSVSAACGLAAYSAWRIAQGLLDAEGKGSEAKGIAVRIGYVGSGLVHAGLAWTAAKLALGWPGESASATRDATAWLLVLPWGPWLVGAIGSGVVGFGLAQFYKSYSKKFQQRLEGQKMSPRQTAFAVGSAQVGLAARGVVFVLIGGFFLSAAWNRNATETGGLGEALRTLETQAYGPALLGITATGLIAYGLLMFVESRFHRIRKRRT
jgi:hypothetical protein